MSTPRVAALLLAAAACGASPPVSRPVVAAAPETTHAASRRFDGALLTRLPRCTPDAPVRLTVDGPSAVAPTEDRPLAHFDAAFGERGGVLVWVTAGRDGDHDGTWIVLLDRELQVRGATRVTDVHWIGAHVVLVDGGAIVAGYHYENDRSTAYVVDAFATTWDGVSTPVARASVGTLLGLAGDRDAIAVVADATHRTSLVRLAFDGHAVVPSTEVAQLGLDVRMVGLGLGDGRLAVRGDRWAMLDVAGDVLTNDGRVTVPSRAGPDDVAERRLAFDDQGVLLVEDLSQARILTRSVVGDRVEDRSDDALEDARPFAFPGVGATIGPRSGANGTSVRLGATVWDLDDDGSWGETWLGWDGRRFVFFYTSDDQWHLYRRTLTCP